MHFYVTKNVYVTLFLVEAQRNLNYFVLTRQLNYITFNTRNTVTIVRWEDLQYFPTPHELMYYNHKYIRKTRLNLPITSFRHIFIVNSLISAPTENDWVTKNMTQVLEWPETWTVAWLSVAEAQQATNYISLICLCSLFMHWGELAQTALPCVPWEALRSPVDAWVRGRGAPRRVSACLTLARLHGACLRECQCQAGPLAARRTTRPFTWRP